ncbi:metal-dependent hydrolase [Mesonia sp. K7]|uniref:metal-dependent hydrolase n=1 Tax=Mesonia sp. K7 TaxID=2218606 RepID=UPI000DA7D13B|nr:metal-dependent hydrolase [Mesonia sp. K7]PZD77250.1 metal-dependent hydrolase [Mesonia sp. K7]
MKITFFGQNSFHIEIAGKNIIVDPFISGNELSKDKVDIHSLKADYILVTHAHQDHTLDVESIAKNTGATIVSNFEITNYYEEKGFTVHPMNHGGSWKFDFGKVKYVHAIHTSTFADGTHGGQPGGFVISAEEKNIYIAGDTALTMDMKLIPMQFPLDLAILPIGDNFTMGVDDAVIASDFLDCNRILGCHYDTFGFIKIDHGLAKEKFTMKKKELILLPINGSLEV